MLQWTSACLSNQVFSALGRPTAIVLVVQFETGSGLGGDLAGFVVTGYTCQINFGLFLLPRFIVGAEIWNLNLAFYDFQTVGIGDLLASAFVFSGKPTPHCSWLQCETPVVPARKMSWHCFASE